MGRPEHAGQRSFEVPLFCGFSKNCWHFPGCQPPPSLERMLHRTPPQRLHIWSQVAQMCVWGVMCLIKLAYKLNSGTEDSAVALPACRRASVQVFVYGSSQCRSTPSLSHSQHSSTHSCLEKVLCSLATAVVSALLLEAPSKAQPAHLC